MKSERKVQLALGVVFGGAGVVGIFFTQIGHYDGSIYPALIALIVASVALLLGMPYPRMSLAPTEAR